MAICTHLFAVAWTPLIPGRGLAGVLTFWRQRGWRATPTRLSATPGIWPPAVVVCGECAGRAGIWTQGGHVA